MSSQFFRLCALILATAAFWPAACEQNPGAVGDGTPSSTVHRDFVGATRCRECHPSQHEAWSGSHHDLAMQPANEETVLGDFAEVEFRDRNGLTRFFRRDGHFFAHIKGPEGAPRDYQVLYTFGVEPLQQYLVGLPGGRLQALTVAWDTRPREQGGQRWFSLHPDEETPAGDVLHWAGPANRWNSMCAHCHSTHVRKGFDPERNRYDTTWSEINVACEACHGPGSEHVSWATRGDAGEPEIALRAESESVWVKDPATGIARRSEPRTAAGELDTCASCHSRRSLLNEDRFAGEYHDTHRLALLDEGLYFADGQVDDEVYVYGSFLQSKMYAAGVSCSDCHDPHSLALRGNTETVCSQCHAPERFASPAHHRHAPGTAGAQCVSCHMPARTYMGVDERRDHSFRIPRPDLSDEIESPNACGACHNDRPAEWAVSAMRAWGATALDTPHIGRVLYEGRRGARDAARGLAALALDRTHPSLVRATALSLLSRAGDDALVVTLERASVDPSPLLRREAARAGNALAPGERAKWVAPLLADPSRSVRIEAARSLAGVSESVLGERATRQRAEALAEYEAALRLGADEPASHLNLALLYAARGDQGRAEAALQEAIERGPHFLPSYVNLADLYRAMGREAEAETILRRALDRAPRNPEVLHALGLALVRQDRLSEALLPFERATDAAPDRLRFAYVYGVALHSSGLVERAIEVLEAARQRWPGDRELLLALVAMSRDAGDLEKAFRYTKELETNPPADPVAAELRTRW